MADNLRPREGKMDFTAENEASAFALDQRWIADHRGALIERYAEQWIAVQNGAVIAHDPDLTRLLSQVPDLEHTCVEFVEQRCIEIETALAAL